MEHPNLETRAQLLEQFVANIDSYAVITLDVDGRVLTWNAGATALSGSSADEIIGHTVSRFRAAGEAGRAEVEHELATALRDGRHEGENWRVRKDGSRFYAHAVTVPIYDAQGAHVGFGRITRDVTRRHLSEKRFTELLEANPDGIVGVDREGAIRILNGQVERMFGYARHELLGQKLEVLLPERFRATHPGQRAAFFGDPSTRAMGADLELFGRRRDGVEFPIDVSLATLDGQDDRLAIASIRDISDAVSARKRAALEARNHQVQRLESLGQLAGGVAHDFNNILAVILNYASFVAEEAEDPEAVRNDIREVQSAAQRAASLTNQLLIFGRRDAAQTEVLDINAVILETESLLRSAVGESVSLRIRLEQGLDNVRAGTTQVEQVLLNLAVNGRDAMPDGGLLVIETTQRYIETDDPAVTTLAPGRYVCLAVSDTGEGMSDSAKRHAFEPFFTTKAKGHGTGLGLATVYGIATKVGGDVTLYSEPGVGTTVRVYFPIIDDVATAHPRSSSPAPASDGERILVVEDEAQVRSLVTRILESHGYSVTVAPSAVDALELLTSETFSLLLTDVVMPGISGPKLAVRARKIAPDIRILFMSGYPEDVWSHGGENNVKFPYISKPFGATELLHHVTSALARGAGGTK